jgi:hypothetical protein
MFVRSRKNVIALATGAILALTMPLTSLTPAAADSALPAAPARSPDSPPAEVSQAVALRGPIGLAAGEFSLRTAGSRAYFPAAPVYPRQIRAQWPGHRVYLGHVPIRCACGVYELVYPIRPVHMNRGCGCGAVPPGWHPNAGLAASWRTMPAPHPPAVTRCACRLVRRAHAVAARPARHRCVHRVRPRHPARCGCRLVVRVHRVARARVARCGCRLVVRVHRVARARVARCGCRLVVRVHRVVRARVARCGCRLLRHVSRVLRVHRARPHVVHCRCMRQVRYVVRHTHCTMRALHRAYRVARVLPRRVQTFVVYHCRHAAAHTTLVSFHRTFWSTRSWGHRPGQTHHCGHWA